MSLTLIKETGAIVAGANTYADVADGDAYHEAHLYAATWTAMSSTEKAAALAMATRLIDQSMQFNGYKIKADQPLQWPRYKCPEPDEYPGNSNYPLPYGTITGYGFVAENVVPKAVVNATIELARRLKEANRTADPSGAAGGIKSLRLEGAFSVEFMDGTDPLPILPREVTDGLWKYGVAIDTSKQVSGGTVKLSRA